MSLFELVAKGPRGRRIGRCIPGCWDGFSGLMVEQAGFPAAFLTGGGLSMARLGRPDVGLVTAAELIDATMQICDRVAIPLIVDCDTGFGNVLTLQRTLRQLERAGAAAVTLEDQVFPKRCGHMEGKQVVPAAEAAGRIRAAVDCRESALIIARSDALAVEGLESALDRAEMFLEAGADMIFIEGPRSSAEAEAIAERFADRVPLVHNLVEGGITPSTQAADFFDLGFALTLHPLLLLHAFAAIGPRVLTTLREDRSTDAVRDKIADLGLMNRLTGARHLVDTGRLYG